jgi:hypothetical protein
MVKEFELLSDGRTVRVLLEGRRTILDGKEIKVLSASLDSRRRMPFWMLTFMIAIILTLGTFGAVALHSLLFSPIVAIGAVSISLFVFLASGRMRTVLMVSTEAGTLELQGDRSDLKKLHFELAKTVLGRTRDREAQEEAGIPPRASAGISRAGTTRSESIMDPDEARKLRDDLGKGVVRRDRIVARTCPHCEGNDLYIEGGMYGGAIYHCKDCDYVGPFIIERELTVK